MYEHDLGTLVGERVEAFAPPSPAAPPATGDWQQASSSPAPPHALGAADGEEDAGGAAGPAPRLRAAVRRFEARDMAPAGMVRCGPVPELTLYCVAVLVATQWVEWWRDDAGRAAREAAATLAQLVVAPLDDALRDLGYDRLPQELRMIVDEIGRDLDALRRLIRDVRRSGLDLRGYLEGPGAENYLG